MVSLPGKPEFSIKSSDIIVVNGVRRFQIIDYIPTEHVLVAIDFGQPTGDGGYKRIKIKLEALNIFEGEADEQ